MNEASTKLSSTGFASKVRSFFLFTPGFSQVIARRRFDWKPFKRFPLNFEARDTWLKPGVNETGYALHPALTFEAKPYRRIVKLLLLVVLCASVPLWLI